MVTEIDSEYAETDDAYAILGVKEEYDIDEIEKSFNRLISLFQPRELPTVQFVAEASLQTSRLQKAFDCLKEPALRRAYDAKKIFHFAKGFYSKTDRKTDFKTYLKRFQEQSDRREDKLRAKFLSKLYKWRSTANSPQKDTQQCEESYEESLPVFAKASVNELQLKKQAVTADFQIWEEGQRDARSIELGVQNREKRVLGDRHALTMEALETIYHQKLQALDQALLQQRTLARRRHEAEVDRLEMRHVNELQAQR
ncbi:MAG: hypothetical protein SGILL_007820 [Bacillariaceae sp.]